ncbi:MAG TPA: winged helix-turn-helix domain-containing protein [Vicinamibacteria bacterium]|jgi:TolB-like protein/DNA-binding winged helix-turn-helix (wHTH) protein/Tfp pilus assembly protein PilF
MPAPDLPRPIYRFGDFEFDPRTAELRRQGRKVRLREQPAQILTLLLARPGDLVTREEARQALWPGDTFVDFDVGLNSAVKRLRDALHDSADQPRFVETLPRRGYRFIAPVEAPPVPPEAAAAEVPATSARGLRSSRFAAPLTTLAVVLVVVLVIVTLSATRRRRPSDPSTPVQITSIAVLPFENLTGDREQDYFADGMTDALITTLAQVRALRVISRTSVTQYAQKDKLLPRIAADLNVDAVVEGTVARSGSRVRVTAQLIHAPTDRHLWARTYEREMRDVLALQGELAGAIAQAVRVELRPDEQRRLAVRGAVDPDAYDAYLKGRYFWNQRSPPDLSKAAEYFQQAIATDPTYAPAYSGLSDTYRLSGTQGLRPRDYMPKAEAAARRALALDETLAEAHASLAGVLYRYHWDWEGAEREFQRSLDLDPSYAEGHRGYAIYLLTVRRHEEAVAEARRARELSPLSPIINVELGGTLVRAGRYDEAIRQAHKALEIDPKLDRAYATLAAAYEGQGDRPKAVAALEKAASLSGRAGSAWLGYFYGVGGRRREALAILAALEERSRRQYVSPQHFAIVQLGLGREEKAFALLEKAYEERAFEMLGFSGLLFDQLSDDPRFQDLLRRMRLPTAASRPGR